MGGYFAIRDVIDNLLDRKFVLYQTMNEYDRIKICFLCRQKIENDRGFGRSYKSVSIGSNIIGDSVQRRNSQYYIYHILENVPLCHEHIWNIYYINFRIIKTGPHKQIFNETKNDRRMKYNIKKLYNQLGYYFFGRKNLRAWRRDQLLEDTEYFKKTYRK